MQSTQTKLLTEPADVATRKAVETFEGRANPPALDRFNCYGLKRFNGYGQSRVKAQRRLQSGKYGAKTNSGDFLGGQAVGQAGIPAGRGT